MHLPWIMFLGLCNFPLFFGAALYAYKRTPFPTLIPFFVYTFLLFEFALSGLRQSMAVGFLLIGMTFFKKEKWYTWLIYFAFNAVAISVHKSSAVMVVYPLLSLIALSKLSIFFFSMILLILIIFVSQIESFAFYIIYYLEYYPNNASSNYTFIFIFLLTTILVVLSIFTPKFLDFLNEKADSISLKLFKKDLNTISIDTSKNKLLFKETFFLSLPLHIFLIIGLFSNTSVRGYYFSVVSFASSIVLFIYSQKSRLLRIVLMCLFIILFSAYFFISFIRRSNCVPYDFIF